MPAKGIRRVEDFAAMATRQLVLVRHGKAADGRWLSEQGIRPDRVLVSPAVRAQQTWSAAAAEMGTAEGVVVDQHIYDNDADRLLEIVHDTPDEVATLLLVGHNPSFEQFAHDLDDGDGDESARRELAAGFSTCGVAVFGTDAAWRELRRATLVRFAAPRG
jgi:phosphohistidine phosphatase